jgi:serine/threonine protein phosphatase PrpC
MTPKPEMSEIDCCGLSQTGSVRADNQDTILLPAESQLNRNGWLFAVADGMGGYAHGQIASSLAVEKLLDAVYGEQSKPGLPALRRGIEAANLSIYQAAQKLEAGRMGTTLTAACILDGQLHLGHVGDSRAYLIRHGKVSCLTNDHTLVGDLVRMHVLGPEKVRSHAQRSVLTRGVGLTLFIKPDLIRLALKPGDRLVLCSDGVWSMMQDDEIACLVERDISACEICNDLINLALERETDDNVSAVVVTIQSLSSPRPDGKQQTWRTWLNPARFLWERSNGKHQHKEADPGNGRW